MDTTQVLDWQTFNTTDGVLSGEDFFAKWQGEVLPKYSKVKAEDLITLIP